MSAVPPHLSSGVRHTETEMKCPYCKTGINLELFGGDQYPLSGEGEEDEHGCEPGYGTAHGWCPECDEFIVLYRQGKVKELREGSWHFEGETDDSVIYPRNSARSILDEEVPELYRESFNQAAAVLSLSPMASAAISRRCLQHLLRQEFGIEKRSLAQEIDEFIQLQNVPSFISDAVDAVRNIGNFAAHPLKDTNTGEIVEVEPGEADWLLEVLESLYDFVFIQPKRLAQRKESLNKKLAAMGKPAMKSSKSA